MKNQILFEIQNLWRILGLFSATGYLPSKRTGVGGPPLVGPTLRWRNSREPGEFPTRGMFSSPRPRLVEEDEIEPSPSSSTISNTPESHERRDRVPFRRGVGAGGSVSPEGDLRNQVVGGGRMRRGGAVAAAGWRTALALALLCVLWPGPSLVAGAAFSVSSSPGPAVIPLFVFSKRGDAAVPTRLTPPPVPLPGHDAVLHREILRHLGARVPRVPHGRAAPRRRPGLHVLGRLGVRPRGVHCLRGAGERVSAVRQLLAAGAGGGVRQQLVHGVRELDDALRLGGCARAFFPLTRPPSDAPL